MKMIKLSLALPACLLIAGWSSALVGQVRPSLSPRDVAKTSTGFSMSLLRTQGDDGVSIITFKMRDAASDKAESRILTTNSTANFQISSHEVVAVSTSDDETVTISIPVIGSSAKSIKNATNQITLAPGVSSRISVENGKITVYRLTVEDGPSVQISKSVVNAVTGKEVVLMKYSADSIFPKGAANKFIELAVEEPTLFESIENPSTEKGVIIGDLASNPQLSAMVQQHPKELLPLLAGIYFGGAASSGDARGAAQINAVTVLFCFTSELHDQEGNCTTFLICGFEDSNGNFFAQTFPLGPCGM